MAVIRKKENRPEAADHVRSKTRNQRRGDLCGAQVSVGLRVPANVIATNKDVGVPTKMSLNVRHRVVSPARHRRKNGVYRNQAQTLARERVTWLRPTLDGGSTH